MERKGGGSMENVASERESERKEKERESKMEIGEGDEENVWMEDWKEDSD